MREDKIKLHLQGEQHQAAIAIDLEEADIRASFAREESDKEAGIAELHKIMLFLVKHNLPHTTLLEELVDLVLTIDTDKLVNIRKGKSTTYTGQASIQKHLQTMSN